MKTLAILTIGLAITLLSFTTPRNLDSPIRLEEGQQIVHHVLLCEYQESIPVRMVELMREIGGIIPIRQEGKSVYLTGGYNSENEAAMALPTFRALGFEAAQHVVRVNDDVYSVRNFHLIYDEQNNPTGKEAQPVIHMWK